MAIVSVLFLCFLRFFREALINPLFTKPKPVSTSSFSVKKLFWRLNQRSLSPSLTDSKKNSNEYSWLF
ncbi:hypothetical protein LJC22_07230, partial [Desulfosarcina sp. OttesenSCG-928-G10]|nr:hypothetical protein [Desulfosarcina sp. OttesenSCG-928-G10]